MNIKEEAHRMKLTAPQLSAVSEKIRNDALIEIAGVLNREKEKIFQANADDLERAEKNGIAGAVLKRLTFNESKLQAVTEGLYELASLPDPVGKVQICRELDENLVLRRISCPIGVIGVIFEARPDAMVQIASLCLKSGNCAILKGGRETASTNRVLFELIREAAQKAGIPSGCLIQAELHNEIDELLSCDRDVDLLIPRGSNAFVRYIMEHTKIPVMGHADGVCHIYVDKDCDEAMALSVIRDAKTQYTAACNAVETLLVNRGAAESFLPKLRNMADEAGIELRGTREAAEILGCAVMPEEAFHTEYLDLILSVKLVEDVREAAEHINRFGSHHTDAIMTDNDDTAAYFMQMVDSAGVYRNCSTRFADGFRYGFGAEVGISTGKLHARGPVGLEGLMTYKYELTGRGHVVGDYASGKKSFHFKNLI